MKLLRTNSRAASAAIIACLVTLVSGCGNQTGLVPVSGKVVFESRDLPKVCRLTFLPVGNSPGGKTRASSATMQPSGDYELIKFQGVPGLYPGEYKITADYYDLKPGGNEDVEADWKEHTYVLPENLVVDADVRRIDFDVVIP